MLTVRYQVELTQTVPSKNLLVVSSFESSCFNLQLVSAKKTQLAPIENKPKQEDVLNAILPPREWVEGGKCIENYQQQMIDPNGLSTVTDIIKPCNQN